MIKKFYFSLFSTLSVFTEPLVFNLSSSSLLVHLTLYSLFDCWSSVDRASSTSPLIRPLPFSVHLSIMPYRSRVHLMKNKCIAGRLRSSHSENKKQLHNCTSYNPRQELDFVVIELLGFVSYCIFNIKNSSSTIIPVCSQAYINIVCVIVI